MAVLTPAAELAPLPGADRVLTAHAGALPQPDQLCGPFAASLALHAVLDEPPGVVEVARASGTAIWPHDVTAWRPSGAPLDRTGWDVLPRAASQAESGTDATGLSAGVDAATGGAVSVVPVAGSAATAAQLDDLLGRLAARSTPLGVLANLMTGPLGVGSGWDVGHFVIIWGAAPGAAGVADSYVELGEPGSPPGCRVVSTDDLAAAMAAGAGRGILLLVPRAELEVTTRSVSESGLTVRLWST